MSDIIRIRFANENVNTEKIKESVKNVFSTIVEKAIELDVWDSSIIGIIVTDDFQNEINKQAEKWNIITRLSREKEYVVVSKILFNHNLDNPQYYIFFDSQYFLNDNSPFVQTAFAQILTVSSKKIIPKELREFKNNYSPNSLEDYIKFASTEWCKSVYTRIYLSKLLTKKASLISHNSFLIAFKRKLKKNLFEYNSDKSNGASRLDLFWHNYFESISTLFLRIVENDTNEKEFLIKVSEQSRDLIYSVICEIKEVTKKCLTQETYDVTNLKESIKNFSAHFEIFLENETEQNFHIRLTKNPKDYFIDEIVETEPRIVCFIDILGFSELINEYDSEITSTVLQDIQESFALAKTQLLENTNEQNKEAIKHLKYQTFSDNICISIPYFDSEDDFLANFNLLITYVRGIQSILMTKGFFTRGGISIGSYYADNNIIFSKGLVNAYHLENKKAVYPRVIIDKTILEKLFKYNQERVKYFGIDSVIIFDWENIAFLNPFGLLKSSVQQIESMFNELNSDDDDPLTKTLNSLTKTFGEMTVSLLKSAEEGEKKGMETVKEKIAENIYRYYKNKNIISKYLWLFEFVKWIEKDETTQLKFQFMSEKITKTENK